MADGTAPFAGIAGTSAAAIESAIESAIERAVAEHAAALAAMGDTERLALIEAAVRRAKKIVLVRWRMRGGDTDAAAAACAELPGLAWLALTDLDWLRARARRRLAQGCPALAGLTERDLVRAVLGRVQDDARREARRGRNAGGVWCGVETALDGRDGRDGDGEPGVVAIDRDSPDLEAEAAQAVQLRADAAPRTAALSVPLTRPRPVARVLDLAPVAVQRLVVPAHWPTDRPFQGELLSIAGAKHKRENAPRRAFGPAPPQLQLLADAAAGGAP